jgi:unsaturated rhamnogalacturonyl hydrolase
LGTGGTVGNSGGAATGGATGGTASGGAATGGATGGTAGSSATGGASGGARTGGTAGSSATGGAAGGARTGGTAGSSATGGAATGGATGGTAGSSSTGGAATGGATGGTAGSGGGGGGGGSTLIGGPGPAAQVITQTGVDWGKLVIDTTMAGKTTLGVTYPEGLMLHGVSKAYKRLKDAKYLNFLTASVDSWLPTPTAFVSLDDLMHNAVLADAYELTQKASYKTTADSVRKIYDTFPKTADGAFWHANRTDRAHQLWGDGTFMSLSVLTRYAMVFNDPTVYPIAVTNLTVTATHLKNPATGLFWHAYDESGVATWSKTASKTNEISWGRAMGWYVMACVMTLEMLPDNDPGRTQVETILKDLITALAKHQDPTTGRWFQVVDMESDARNWTETSCSSMYSYVVWWAYQHGLVDASFADVAKKGFAGVMQKVTKNATNQTTIATICTGLDASATVTGYFSHATASNDLHGIGAFLLMWEGMQ